MLRHAIPSVFVIVCACACARAEPSRAQAQLLEHCEQADMTTLVDTIRQDLLSKDPLVQDAGCIILAKILEGLQRGDARAESVLARLSADRNVVASAADMVDSRLLGWYGRERPEEDDDDIGLYVPLFHILAGTDHKIARETLVRSYLFLHNRGDVLKGIPVNEELVGILLRRLRLIDEKFCCVYPGREFVVEMLEKDSRLNMLGIYEELLAANREQGVKTKREALAFVTECLDYGDARNGHRVRIKAAEVAAVLIRGGERDLQPKLGHLSRSDPYFVHKRNGRAGYSMTELRYPVREACAGIMLGLRSGASVQASCRQGARP